jgi:hypothetical protein
MGAIAKSHGKSRNFPSSSDSGEMIRLKMQISRQKLFVTLQTERWDGILKDIQDKTETLTNLVTKTWDCKKLGVFTSSHQQLEWSN